MEEIFEKESILLEWVPFSVLTFLSLVFVVFTITSKTVFMVVGCLAVAVMFASFPVMTFFYLRSFQSIKVTGNTIEVVQGSGSTAFTVPHDMSRLTIDADDLRIELGKNGKRFVLRSHFLKNKTAFHQLFDHMLKEDSVATGDAALEPSVLERMERLKAK